MGDLDSEVRIRSDRIREKFIMPAAKEAGYKIVEEESQGLTITPDIIKALEGDSMVIAYLGCPPPKLGCPVGNRKCPLGNLDYYPWNPNVMFEMGYRLATDKPFVILKHSKPQLPFDLKDYSYVNLPPYDELETIDKSRVERLVEQIVKRMLHRRSLSHLNSAYAIAEILIDQREGAKQESIFSASSKAADRIFHANSLIGRDIIEIEKSLFLRLEKYQVEPFDNEQNALLGRLVKGVGRNPNKIRAKVPFIFKKSSVDDENSRQYIHPKLRGRAFLALIVQHRQLKNALSLRMLYFDVTGAIKRVGDYYVCDPSKVAQRIGKAMQETSDL